MMRIKISGFTLVELIVTMMIIGILSVAAMSRFFDRATFDNRGFNDGVLATLRHAQKIAIAQRRTVCVTFTASSVTLTMSTAAGATTCAVATQLTSPTGASPYTLAAPANSAAAFSGIPASFNYDALGRAVVGTTATTQTITVSGLPSFTLEGETGYAHP